MDSEVKDMKRECVEFSQEKGRLDDFYFKVAGISKYKDLSFVLKLILTLSHGQASVERGFSLNNNAIKTNMSPESLVAKRIIKDHMIANNLKPHTIEITKQIIRAFKSGRQKYSLHLEEEKKKKEKSELQIKAQHIAADIDKIRVLQKQKQKAVEMMEKEVVECMEKAEKNNDTCMSYVIKSNGLKRKSQETKKEIETLEKEILDLEVKKKKFSR